MPGFGPAAEILFFRDSCRYRLSCLQIICPNIHLGLEALRNDAYEKVFKNWNVTRGPKTIDAQSGHIIWSRRVNTVGRSNSLCSNKARPHKRNAPLQRPSCRHRSAEKRVNRIGGTKRQELFGMRIKRDVTTKLGWIWATNDETSVQSMMTATDLGALPQWLAYRLRNQEPPRRVDPKTLDELYAQADNTD